MILGNCPSLENAHSSSLKTRQGYFLSLTGASDLLFILSVLFSCLVLSKFRRGKKNPETSESLIVYVYGATTKSCQTLCDPMDCSPPGFLVRGISQARMLEWIALSFSRGSSQPGDRTRIFCIGKQFFTSESLGKPKSLLYTHQ